MLATARQLACSDQFDAYPGNSGALALRRGYEGQIIAVATAVFGNQMISVNAAVSAFK